ncbi:MAG TPA: hypothetical protein VFA98_13045 [Thermoanaerobaculia bacterium]|jgi:hypothetical protein|nr:hypothetical protein [Thermoanaerobaculia bacterium]
MTRASFRKLVKKATERAGKAAPTHEVSSSCLCLQCVMARYHALSISLETMLFEAVQRKIARATIAEEVKS